MDNFYFTFGYGNATLRNRFLKIKAESMEEARKIVFDSRVGNTFAFCYTEEEFMPQIEKYKLTEVVLGEIHVA